MQGVLIVMAQDFSCLAGRLRDHVIYLFIISLDHTRTFTYWYQYFGLNSSRRAVCEFGLKTCPLGPHRQ